MADDRVVLHFRIVIVNLLLLKTTGCQGTCSAVGLDFSSIIPDSSFTASSIFPTSPAMLYRPSKARFSSDLCWEPYSNDDPDDYLQIDLGKVIVICAVATKGSAGSHVSEWTTEYKISTSSDGNLWITYFDNSNSSKLFPGNTDRNTAVKNYMAIPVLAKFIRFTPTQYHDFKALRVEVYGIDVQVCSKMSVGLPYSSLIPDHRFTASSFYDNRYIPSNARLKNTKAWEPKTKNVGDWLKIDLGSVVYVCAVATQGNAYLPDEYAKKYKLKISLDNVNWRYYQENNADKVFIGNTNKDAIVKNTLADPTRIKFLKFYPTEFEEYAAMYMRVDVYGVPTSCNSPFGVEKGGSVKDSKMTSSSQSDSSHAVSFGRLYGDASWCSNTPSKTEYIQIDLDKMVTLTGIATQGDHTIDKWVKTYTLKYSIDGRVWNDYRGDQPSARIFQGNSDRTSIVVRWFSLPVKVRYVRVYPQSWNTAICMRIELFGCICRFQDQCVGLGLDDTSTIPDCSFTSSSELRNTYAAAKARFSSDRCWEPNGNGNPDDYLQIDLGKVFVICAVATKGNAKPTITEWTTEYKISTSSDGTLWIAYFDTNSPKLFPGNADGNTTVKNDLDIPVLAKFIKFTPTQYKKYKALRVEVYGFDAKVTTASGVKAVVKTSQSILVTWQVFLGIKCAPFEYKVIYSKTSGGRSQEVHVGQNTSHTLTNLEQWTEYSITVNVGNDKGYGLSSSAVVKRTLEDNPDAAPQNFAVNATCSSTSFRLSWDSPHSDKRNGIIKGYKLWYCKTGHCSSPSVKDCPGTSTVLDNLDTYTDYTFKVLAYTSVGDGPYTTNITRKTLEGLPDSPKDMSFKRNTASYKISWQPVPSTNGRILVYEIKKLSIRNSYETREMINVSCSEVPYDGSVNHDCSYFLHNTQKCLIYEISIRAYTTKGPGPFSNHLITQSPGRGTPKEFTTISVDQNSVCLKWKEPENLNIPVKNYTIKYSGENSRSACPCNDSSLNGKVVTNFTKITINGLYPATRYRFTVSATNECGEGKDSEEQVNQTKPEQDGKKGLSHEDNNSTTEKNSFYISLSFNVIFLVIIILLLVLRYLKNQGSVKEQPAGRNNKEKTSQQQIVYENTRVIEDRAPDEGIQMSDIPTTISPVYDSIDQYQNPSHPTIPSTPHGKGNTSASDLPGEAYQALDISQQVQGSVYEELNQNTKSSGQSCDSNYQSLTMDVQNSPYQRLHLDGKSATNELRI